MKVPTIGESITEVTLSQWLIGNGEYVELDQPICEFESDKATLEFPAEASGKLIYVAAEGDELEIGALVAKIDTSAVNEKKAPEPEVELKEEKSATPTETTYAKGHPSPSAAKLMREKGLSSEQIEGTGKDGRITKEDAQKAEPKKTADASTPTPSITGPKVSFSRNSTRKKMSRMRRTIAKRLVSAKNGTAMLTTFNEVDLTEVMKLRKTYQERFVEKHGVKLGFMSIFAKACAQVLLEMPDVNAQLDGEELIHHDFVDISIAISTPTGLVVPPVLNVESLNFHEIEYAIKALAGKSKRWYTDIR